MLPRALCAGLVLLIPALASAQPLTSQDRRILNSLVEQTLERYRVEAREATAQGNPNPAVNLEHVERLIAQTEAEASQLRERGISPEVARAAMAFSDLGKNPGSLVEYANRVFPSDDPGRFRRAFLLHEVVGRAEFRRLAMDAGLSKAAIQAVERANVGHNGPSVPGTWWHETWRSDVERYQGPVDTSTRLGRLTSYYVGREYPMPTTQAGAYHTALDRRDQGTRDGSLKIMAETMTGEGRSLQQAFDELFRRNQAGTQLQFDALRRTFPEVFELPSVQEAERAVANTVRYANHVRFSEGGTRAEIKLPDGRVVEATTYEEFKAALEQIREPSERPLFEGTHDPVRRLAELRERTLPQLLREARREGIQLKAEERRDRSALLSRLTGMNAEEVGQRMTESPRPQARRGGATRRLQELAGSRANGQARPRVRR